MIPFTDNTIIRLLEPFSNFTIEQKKTNSCIIVSDTLSQLKAKVTNIPDGLTTDAITNIKITFEKNAIKAVLKQLSLSKDQKEIVKSHLVDNILKTVRRTFSLEHSKKIAEKKLSRSRKQKLIGDHSIVKRATTSDKEIEAIKKIQSHGRAYLQGREFPYLSGKRYIDQESLSTKLSKMPHGTTPVYSSQGLKVVLKKSGKLSAARLKQMEYVRQFCTKNSYTHLIVPKGIEYKEHIIEDKLNVNPNTEYQICLYAKHIEKFDEAVKEFTGFLCTQGLSDLVAATSEVFWMFEKGQLPMLGRYDNAPLYMNNGEGAIGLIDLERLGDGKDIDLNEVCRIAIVFFPYHYQLIIDTVKKIHPKFLENKEKLNSIRRQTLSVFEKIYESHRRYIDVKGIKESSIYSIDSESIDVKSIKESAETRLAKFNKTYKENIPTSCITECLANLPNILTLIASELKASLSTKVKDSDPDSKDHDIDLLLNRRVSLPHRSLLPEVPLTGIIDPLKHGLEEYAAKLLVDVVVLPSILCELKNKNQIALYICDIYTRSHIIQF